MSRWCAPRHPEGGGHRGEPAPVPQGFAPPEGVLRQPDMDRNLEGLEDIALGAHALFQHGPELELAGVEAGAVGGRRLGPIQQVGIDGGAFVRIHEGEEPAPGLGHGRAADPGLQGLRRPGSRLRLQGPGTREGDRFEHVDETEENDLHPPLSLRAVSTARSPPDDQPIRAHRRSGAVRTMASAYSEPRAVMS